MYSGFITAGLYCLYVIASGATFVLNWMLFWLFLPFIVYIVSILLTILISSIYALIAPKEQLEKTLKWLDKFSFKTEQKYFKEVSEISELLKQINENKK